MDALENRLHVDAYGEEGYILINCDTKAAIELRDLLTEELRRIGVEHE